MKVIIPDDWNGSQWACWRVWWPNSERWTSLLYGLLTTPTRGRWYDETTGRVTDAQSVGSEIFDKNIPLASCDTVEDTQDEPSLQDVASAMIGAGITLLGDDMGQVVTEIRIVNGKLRVYYGHCCYDDLELTSVDIGTGVVIPQPDDEDNAITIPGELTDFVTSSCAKSCVLVDMLESIVDIILDGIWAGHNPMTVHNDVRDAYPGVAFGSADFATAYTAGLSITAAGRVEETEDQALYQDMRALFAGIIANDMGGVTSDEYDALKTAQYGLLSEYFSLDTYPLVFQSMRDIHSKVLSAIGANDIRNLTSYVVATGDEDCGPTATVAPETSEGYYLGENLADSVYSVTDYWYYRGVRALPSKPVHGIYVKLESGPDGQYKTMAWSHLSSYGAAEVSAWGDSSGHYESMMRQGYPLIYLSTDAAAAEVADIQHDEDYTWFNAPDESICNAGKTFGSCMAMGHTGNEPGLPIIAEWRMIYKNEVD